MLDVLELASPDLADSRGLIIESLLDILNSIFSKVGFGLKRGVMPALAMAARGVASE